MNADEIANESKSDFDEKNVDASLIQPHEVSPDADSSLEALVSQEQTFVRDRLREELGREPTQEEADKFLSGHTESY